jgi:alcohol oxidase
MGSPLVLQRSGIGAADRLASAGIKTIVDLPGVGASYEDHNLVMLPFHVPDDAETIDPILEQEPRLMEKLLAMFAHGKGALTSNGIDAGSKLRPTEEELKEIGPRFNEVWKKYFESKPDKVRLFSSFNEFSAQCSIQACHAPSTGQRFRWVSRSLNSRNLRT